MPKEMLINSTQQQECRIAIVSDGQLQELYIERASSASHLGNIYKGRITNIEPSIQAAFVDFGLGKNGFLHITDVHPRYFPKRRGRSEPVGRKQPYRDRPSIQSCLQRGQEIVVQVTKEGIGTKGPTLTTYLSIPGRLLVLMPGMSRLGVSRKIEDEETRKKARGMLEQLKLPPEMGFIIRTAGVNHTKRDLRRDLNYLLRLWKAVKERIDKAVAPAEIYQESDLVIRTIRDIYNSSIDRIVCDNKSDAASVQDFLNVAVPRNKSKVELYAGTDGLFHDFGLEDQIEKIYARQVELPSGGSLVIDQTEALVAIDVNSGRFRGQGSPEATALKINTEAIEEVTRQLRLRDLGGVIVIDLIDMAQEKNRRTIERALRQRLRQDRAKTKVSRMSMFGLLEMTRQRVRPSLRDSMHRLCPYCHGVGMVKSDESQALEAMRYIKQIASNDEVARVEVRVTPRVAEYLSNVHRQDVYDLERRGGKRIVIRADEDLAANDMQTTCIDRQGKTVPCTKPTQTGKKTQALTTPIEKIQRRKEPAPAGPQAATSPATPSPEPPPKRRSRRSGKKRKKTKEAPPPPEQSQQARPQAADQQSEPSKRKKTRRGKRGGARRRRKKKSDAPKGASNPSTN